MSDRSRSGRDQPPEFGGPGLSQLAIIQTAASPFDVWQAAALLVGLYGLDAGDYARGQAQDRPDDRCAELTWELIAGEIDRLLRGAPPTVVN